MATARSESSDSEEDLMQAQGPLAQGPLANGPIQAQGAPMASADGLMQAQGPLAQHRALQGGG